MKPGGETTTLCQINWTIAWLDCPQRPGIGHCWVSAILLAWIGGQLSSFSPRSRRFSSLVPPTPTPTPTVECTCTLSWFSIPFAPSLAPVSLGTLKLWAARDYTHNFKCEKFYFYPASPAAWLPEQVLIFTQTQNSYILNPSLHPDQLTLLTFPCIIRYPKPSVVPPLA